MYQMVVRSPSFMPRIESFGSDGMYAPNNHWLRGTYWWKGSQLLSLNSNVWVTNVTADAWGLTPL